MSVNLGVANLITHNPPLETLTLQEKQIGAIGSPRISAFLILSRQSPLVLVPRLHRLRGPGGSGDENGAQAERDSEEHAFLSKEIRQCKDLDTFCSCYYVLVR